ncbi:hypothetical protein R0J87_13550 [Halomonas sp. SIMBA_159]
MTVDAVAQTQDAAELVEAMAEEAQREEGYEQQEQAAEGDWSSAEQDEQQVQALAKMAVQGVEMAAELIKPGHKLDAESRAQGEAAMMPVAQDFAGELPEWLKPYVHYLAAGLWMGGVMVGAYKAKREEEAEQEKQAKAKQKESEGGADGLQP